jgi:hypothetical protein
MEIHFEKLKAIECRRRACPNPATWEAAWGQVGRKPLCDNCKKELEKNPKLFGDWFPLGPDTSGVIGFLDADLTHS